MRLKSVIILSAMAVIICLGIIAFAKDSDSTKTKMEAPQIPAEINKLDVFIGDWHGTGSMTYMGETKKIDVSHKYEKLSFGWGLQLHETAKIPGMKAYEALDLLGYDMGGGKFHLYTVSNYGDTHDHIGGWVNDKSLYFEYNGMMDGKPFQEKLPIVIDSPNQYSFYDTVFVAGQVAQTFTGIMKKGGK